MKDITNIKSVIIPAIFLICLIGCKKPPRNYYADQDDPGLSRLTSYGYNIATNYINGIAYINPYYTSTSLFGTTNGGNVIPTLSKILGNNTTDTLALSWPIEINTPYSISDAYIDLLIIVPKNFMESDFVTWSGKRFVDTTNRISMSQGYYYIINYPVPYPNYSDSSLQGVSNIYFVNIVSSSGGLSMEGLFNGTIGNDVSITNGRFDFYLPQNHIHF
jgi:hypothetical protein